MANDDISEQMRQVLLEGVPGVLYGAAEILEQEIRFVRNAIGDCLAECRATCEDCVNYCSQRVRDSLALGKTAVSSGVSSLQPQVGAVVRELLSDVTSLLSGSGVGVAEGVTPSFVQPSSSFVPRGRDPEPPPGAAGCRDPLRPPQCVAPWFAVRLVYENGQWTIPPFDYRTVNPNAVLIPPLDVYWLFIIPGGWQQVTEVPQSWPPGLQEVAAVCMDDQSRPCLIRGRHSGSQVPPPTPISGIPPPPTIITPPPPPPPIPPPSIEPPGIPPPVVDIGCPPADPCYPTPTTLVSDGVYQASQRPSRYWVLLRCIDRCSAQIQCWYGDCPPQCPPGWRCFGMYDHCPTPIEIEWLVRNCLPGEPPPPPPGLPPPISNGTPPPIQPPGVEEPPPPPPPPEEGCEVYESHPPRWQATFPVCVDESAWYDKLMGPIAGHRDVYDAAMTLDSHYPDKVLPNYMDEWNEPSGNGE